MKVLTELWNGTDYTFVLSTAERVQRWMADEGIRDTRAPAGGQRQRMDNAESDEIQDALNEEEGREGGAREGGMADEADEGVGEPDLPGEEVVMTSRGVGQAGPAPRAPRPELDHARREKRAVGEAGVEVRDTSREKRARQTTIDEMYAREKLAEFTDAWLQWIYVKGLPFNAFRGPEFQKVRQTAERVPRSIQFRFPSFKVTAGTGIPSQRAKVETMVSEVRAAFRHSSATMLFDRRNSRNGKPLLNFLAKGANGALLYATIARDGSVRDTANIVYRRWRAIILSFPTKDVIGSCTDSASRRDALESMLHGDAWSRIPWERRHVSQAQWVQQQIRDGEFWQCVQYAILVMSPVHQLYRRMDRGGMMMSVVYEWSRHVVQLMRRVDVPEDMIEPCVREVSIRNLHMLEPAHVAAHLLNPRRRSLTYYHSLETTADDRRMVEECDRSLLAQTGGDPVGRLYRTMRDQMRAFHSRRGDWGGDLCDAEAEDCRGDSETGRCAAWWFEHGRAHPELHTIAICVMHLWTSASPAERNWAQHERVNTARRCKLGFAKLAQLQGGGYVLPWVMGTGRGGTAAEEEDEDGDVEPEVWGARPAGNVPEVEIERQSVAFHHSQPSRAHSVWDVFGIRATELRPWPEGGDDVDAAAADDDIDDEWTDDDDTPLSSDPTAEQVYFTYGGGRDGMDSFTSVISGGAPSTAQASGSSRAGGGRGGRSHAEREMETGGGGGRDVDASGSPEEAVQGEFDDEGQDAAAGGGSGGGRRSDEETAGDEEQDVVVGGGSPSGGRGDIQTAGDEGQGAAVCARGEGGPGGDGDTAGVGGDDGPDGDDDDDHGPEDDAYRLAFVLRDPIVPPLHPDDIAHTFFDVDALAQAFTDDPFAHVSRKSGKRRAPGRVYSPPPFVVESPHWSGSSLSGVRGRESGAGEVGSGRRSDGGRDSAGSMPPPPARTPEGRVDTRDQTAAPGVAHSGGSPPTVRGWSAVRRMAGRMLGLSRAETRRSLVLEAAGTSTDMLRGEQFTSGEQGLLRRPGTRRQHGLSEVEARLAAGVAAGQAALDAIQREREMGIAARAAEDEDVDTESEPIETAARRHKAQVAAAAAAAQAAYLSGARGTGAGGRRGRRGWPSDLRERPRALWREMTTCTFWSMRNEVLAAVCHVDLSAPFAAGEPRSESTIFHDNEHNSGSCGRYRAMSVTRHEVLVQPRTAPFGPHSRARREPSFASTTVCNWAIDNLVFHRRHNKTMNVAIVAQE
ncbi:hypothetical protein CBR_g8066 [Chara braunii]|uniref:DUF659 domain-containing protein n=1 Tax=Chara braunii TaxID=69332 RepID=A0A388KL99_CHABU|nr:hypothetical protein CBR_g8066 [Chara braunii]|eukprot:GBG70768.1 hypothetical protein CBR_g8066 [Chara braunii]